MARDPSREHLVADRHTRLSVVLGSIVWSLAMVASAAEAGIDPDLCGSDVTDIDALIEAIGDFIDDESCSTIEITEDIDVDKPLPRIAAGDPDIPEPIDKSLTIRGNGSVLTAPGHLAGFVAHLGGGSERRTLTIDDLGMTDFGDTGAVTVWSGDLLIQRSRFWGNSFDPPEVESTAQEASAGAVNAYDGLSIIESEFADNSGSEGGAVHSSSDAAVSVSSSTFSHNSADYGGAMYLAGSLMMNNSTVSGNTAVSAGALNVVGTITVIFCTIVDNMSTTSNAAVTSTGDITVIYSIVYGNRFTDSDEPELFADFTTEGSLDVESSLVTTDVGTSSILGLFSLDEFTIVGVDPNLQQLGDHGGFTLPGGTRISTHPPRSSSQVIDTIDLVAAGSDDGPNDQRGAGFPRVVHERADMGSVEYRPSRRRLPFPGSLLEPEHRVDLPDTR